MDDLTTLLTPTDCALLLIDQQPSSVDQHSGPCVRECESRARISWSKREQKRRIAVTAEPG